VRVYELVELAGCPHGEFRIHGRITGVDALELTAIPHLESREQLVDQPAVF
jgi:hypothetical protein